MDGHTLKRAVTHPSNYKPILFCTISLVAIGILMVIFGILILLIDHIEMGPPHYDTQYERYQGSSLAHVLGPMFVGFGLLNILGNIVVLAYATRCYYAQSSSNYLHTIKRRESILNQSFDRGLPGSDLNSTAPRS